MPDRPSIFDLPDQGDEPVVWDPQKREFVPVPPAPARPATGPKQQWFVSRDHAGKAPPPRDGGNGNGTSPPTATAVAPTRAPAAATPAAVAPAPVAAPVAPAPAPAPVAPRSTPRPVTGRGTPPPKGPGPTAPAAAPQVPKAKRRKRIRFLPRLRWIVLTVVLLPLLLGAWGWWYANAKFDEIARVPVSAVLSPDDGPGTNYLLVGSDSREAVTEAGSADPNVQAGGEAPGGQRSDTMLILRTTSEGALLLSVPRDLFVTLPDGSQGRINGAFNDGPAALIQTIETNLDIPIQRYVEVDFVTFSGLVDALGGITIGADIIPCPAFDDHSGLAPIPAGPVTMDGATALAFVRSRHYTQDCGDGPEVDPTADLGRIKRQQAFLRTVMADAGASRNPFTLMDIADSVSGGLRIDDGMSLWDAVRFAWDMGRLDPVSVELPTEGFRTSAGAAVLRLVEPGAQAALDQFR